MKRSSRLGLTLSGKVTAIFAAVLILTAAVTAAIVRFVTQPWLVFLLTLAIGFPLGAWLLNRLMRPTREALRVLTDGIRSFKDRDYSVRLAPARNDELGQLVRLYNDLGDLLRQERSALYQKELMLDTVLQSSPTAMVLTNPLERVVFSNRSARQLLFSGKKMEGHNFHEVLQGCPPGMRALLEDDKDALFTVETSGEQETYHMSRRLFHLNGQRHYLHLVQRLTRELSRQEVEVWKKVIRVISHELNNSLAPISSLVHSSRIIAGDPRHAHQLETVFESITERLDYLKTFLEGYARFARLPRPRKQPVEWQPYLDQLQRLYSFKVEGKLPTLQGHFDPSQMQQVLINLLKNAEEASDGQPDVRLRVDSTPERGVLILVMDRGRGMEEEVLKQALLPFYSTKQTGTGLGLPLCREIVEAHGGRLQIQNREGGGTMVACFLPPL